MTELSTTLYTALGRMTWAAIGVEDRALALASSVLGLARTSKSVGTLLAEAIEHLERGDSTNRQMPTVEWLRRARSGLERRNEILHSTYGEWWTVTNGKAERPGDFYLVHLPSNRSKPVVQLPVNEATFLDLADDLTDIIASWVEATLWSFNEGGAG